MHLLNTKMNKFAKWTRCFAQFDPHDMENIYIVSYCYKSFQFLKLKQSLEYIEHDSKASEWWLRYHTFFCIRLVLFQIFRCKIGTNTSIRTRKISVRRFSAALQRLPLSQHEMISPFPKETVSLGVHVFMHAAVCLVIW